MSLYWLALAELLYNRVTGGKHAFRQEAHEIQAHWIRIAQESSRFFGHT